MFLAMLGAAVLASCSDDEDPVVQAKLGFDAVAGEDLVEFSDDGSSGAIVFAPEGGTVTLKVGSNQPEWSYVADGADWCEVARSGDELTVTAPLNETTASFSAKITVSTGELDNTAQCVITVRQTGVPSADLVLSPSTLEFDSAGGTQEVTVTTNQSDDWVVRVDEGNFLTPIKSEGKITVIAKENLKSEELAGKITVVSGNGENLISAELSVVQHAAPRVQVAIDPSSLSFDADGGTQRVKVTVTNYDGWVYQVADENGWYTFVQEGDELVVTAPKNRSAVVYNAQVQIGAGNTSNNDIKTLTLTQAGSQNADAMILQLTIPEGGAKGVLPLEKVGAYTVDWGDGSEVESLSGTFPDHDYAEGGVYEVAVKGEVFKLNAGSSLILVKNRDAVSYMTGVILWGNTGLTSMERAFYKATNLTSIPADTQESFYDVTTFKYAFYQTPLTGIPAGLFAHAPNATDFEGCFSGCENLVTIPSGLFTPCVSAKIMNEVFSSCKALAHVPDNLFAGCAAVTKFFRVFWWCDALETVGNGVFKGCTEVTDFGQSFYNCAKLQSVPADIFDDSRKAADFKNAFKGAKSLTGESPYTVVNGTKVHLYERDAHTDTFAPITGYSSCFNGCTGLTDYAAIEAAGWN